MRMRTFALFALMMVLLGGSLYAQAALDPAAGVGTDPDPLSLLNLTSTASIVTASIFLTFLAKRGLVGMPMLESVPTWIYVGLISIGLTLIANRVTGTLQGSLGRLMLQGVLNGALASGLREWMYNAKKPISAAGTGAGILLLLLIPLSLAGCASNKTPKIPGVEPSAVQLRINIVHVHDGTKIAATGVMGAYDIAKNVGVSADVLEQIRVTSAKFSCAVQYERYADSMALCATAGYPTYHLLDVVDASATAASLKEAAAKIMDAVKPLLDQLARDPKLASTMAIIAVALETVRIIGGLS